MLHITEPACLLSKDAGNSDSQNDLPLDTTQSTTFCEIKGCESHFSLVNYKLK